MSPSIGSCFATSGILVSCSLLTLCLCSFSYLSYGHDTCGTFALYLPTCTSVGTTDGAILPLVIFWTCVSVPSCYFLIVDLEAPPSSTFFFLLRAFFEHSVTTLFLFSNVLCISSLVILTLAYGFCGFSFWWTNKYLNFFASIKANW